MRSSWKRSICTAAAGLAMTAGSLVAAAPAQAAGSPYISGAAGGANVRTCAATYCGVKQFLANGTGVRMVCWVDGQWATGNYSSPRWFFVDYSVNSGWVHSSLVANQSSVGRC